MDARWGFCRFLKRSHFRCSGWGFVLGPSGVQVAALALRALRFRSLWLKPNPEPQMSGLRLKVEPLDYGV